MANTMTLIASNTVAAGGVSSVTFSIIPTTYTDLLLKVSHRSNVAGTPNGDSNLIINGETTNTNYGEAFTYSTNGTAVVSSTGSPQNLGIRPNGNTSTANTFSNYEVYIPNYQLSQTKLVFFDGVDETNAAASFLTWANNKYINTAAITSIGISAASYTQTILQNSTTYLYGISKS
jgi:hypothetical protein